MRQRRYVRRTGCTARTVFVWTTTKVLIPAGGQDVRAAPRVNRCQEISCGPRSGPFRQAAVQATAREGLLHPRAPPDPIVELAEEQLAAARTAEVTGLVADDAERDRPREGSDDNRRAAAARPAHRTAQDRKRRQVEDE